MPILTCSSETSKSVIDRLRYPGFCIDTVRIENETLFLELTPSGAPVCPKCGQRSPKVHDVSYRHLWNPKQSLEPEAKSSKKSQHFP